MMSVVKRVFPSISGLVLFIAVVFFLLFHAVESNAETVFRLAVYNVQNLFDLDFRGTEYEEYVPDGPSGWNSRILEHKYINIAKVISDLKADVIALVEIESEKALAGLSSATENRYPYCVMVDTGRQAVGCAVLSSYPITGKKDLKVYNGRGRSILKATLMIEGQPFIVYVNHWPSKRNPESKRIGYARVLKKDIRKIKQGTDYVVVGDFNSGYDEYRTLAGNRNLDDTHGRTGINHILETMVDNALVDISKIKSEKGGHLLFNLWLEKPAGERWSYIFFGRKETLDHILVPKSMFDGRGIDYSERSFNNFAPKYLYDGKQINRWKMSGKNVKKHVGRGYSDHLPVYADFVISR